MLDAVNLNPGSRTQIINIAAGKLAIAGQGAYIKINIAIRHIGTVSYTHLLVLICYSGKKYAETATGLLKDMGVAATQIYTLEGGHNGWAEDADYTSYIVEGAEPGALAE